MADSSIASYVQVILKLFANNTAVALMSKCTIFLKNRNVVMTPIEASSLLDASSGIPFASMEGSKIIQLPLTTSTVVDENGQQIQLQVWNRSA
jgi:hypothetical protein